jgi:hypothetical protein
MKKLKFPLIALLFAGLFTMAFLSCKKVKDDPSVTSDGKAAAKMDAPIIACAGSSDVSIKISVTGGPNTGAPAGFSLQWMTAAEYAANGNSWYASDDVRLCKASFSGNANLGNYNLGKNQTVIVKVGDFLLDEGASTNCGDGLVCGTEYVFRAFAHATSTINRSDFTANLSCSTLPCDTNGECTYTQGYWKSHGPIPLGNNSNEWAVTSLTLGNTSYTDLELLSILNAPVNKNGLIALAHQLIAAKLNLAKPIDGSSIQASIDAADALIGNLVIPPVGGGSLSPAATSALVDALADFNEGATGPGHCN